MQQKQNEKHKQTLPSLRNIRRACNKELYRTVKKLKIWVPPDQLEEAEKLYVKKVVLHLPWITENGSNRKTLADWWGEQVCPEIAALWNVEQEPLGKAFRESFGG